MIDWDALTVEMRRAENKQRELEDVLSLKLLFLTGEESIPELAQYLGLSEVATERLIAAYTFDLTEMLADVDNYAVDVRYTDKKEETLEEQRAFESGFADGYASGQHRAMIELSLELGRAGLDIKQIEELTGVEHKQLKYWLTEDKLNGEK